MVVVAVVVVVGVDVVVDIGVGGAFDEAAVEVEDGGAFVAVATVEIVASVLDDGAVVVDPLVVGAGFTVVLELV